jgi:hypothetical protein
MTMKSNELPFPDFVMKLHTYSSALLILSVSAVGSEIPPDFLARAKMTSPTTMRGTATHEQLVRVYKKTLQENPLGKLEPAEGPDPSKTNRPKSLLSRSDIICFGGRVTLVPKRAILNMPAKYADRLKVDPTAKAQGWLDFYTMNRGWITTVEVTRTQAEGNSELGEELAERVRKSSNMVVATYKGGPISVLPLKVEDETKTEK